MAELVDALVSNTSGFTSMPVRSRLWVLQSTDYQGFFFLSGVLKVYFLTKRKRKSTFAVLATFYALLTKMLHISSFLLLLFALKTVSITYLCNPNRF